MGAGILHGPQHAGAAHDDLVIVVDALDEPSSVRDDCSSDTLTIVYCDLSTPVFWPSACTHRDRSHRKARRLEAAESPCAAASSSRRVHELPDPNRQEHAALRSTGRRPAPRWTGEAPREHVQAPGCRPHPASPSPATRQDCEDPAAPHEPTGCVHSRRHRAIWRAPGRQRSNRPPVKIDSRRRGLRLGPGLRLLGLLRLPALAARHWLLPRTVHATARVRPTTNAPPHRRSLLPQGRQSAVWDRAPDQGPPCDPAYSRLAGARRRCRPLASAGRLEPEFRPAIGRSDPCRHRHRRRLSTPTRGWRCRSARRSNRRPGIVKSPLARRVSNRISITSAPDRTAARAAHPRGHCARLAAAHANCTTSSSARVAMISAPICSRNPSRRDATPVPLAVPGDVPMPAGVRPPPYLHAQYLPLAFRGRNIFINVRPGQRACASRRGCAPPAPPRSHPCFR
jgi:hypothetical protein